MLIDATLLSIDGIDLSEFSARGLTQTLEPIDQARQIRRTVNGTARDISAVQFQDKYTTVITCTDQEGPGFVGVRPGKLVQIVCLADLGGGGDSDYPLSLSMLVVSWHVERNEAGAQVGWTLTAVSV